MSPPPSPSSDDLSRRPGETRQASGEFTQRPVDTTRSGIGRPDDPSIVPLDFQLLRLAGRGAFGAVWVARDRTGILLAVKIVEPAALPGFCPGEREEQALALVRRRVPHHPHLVRIFHVSRQEGRLLYAMELADPAADAPPADQEGYQADTLAHRIATHGRLPLTEALGIALDLLQALDSLHQAGLVHRDVKPGNVIFVDGIPKLADVGLAATIQTQMSLAGTMGFLPLDGSTGPDADLYAIGKLLYQCVTACDPAEFPTVPAQLLMGPDARAFRRLNRVLLRACAPTRGERFPTAAAMRAALTTVQRPPHLLGASVFLCSIVLLALLVGALVLRIPWTAAPRSPEGSPEAVDGQITNRSEATDRPTTPPEVPPAPSERVFFRPGDDASLTQHRLARELGLPLTDANSIGMQFILIPPGEFWMGSFEDEKGRHRSEHRHRVQITRPFYLGMHEVTQEQYQRILGDNPSRIRRPSHPVEQVTWYEAVAFCEKLSQLEGQRYRLPTEAEWEYACRAGTTTRTYQGDTLRLDHAHVRGREHLSVGQFPPNPFGLHDMVGNVCEWCSDWFSDEYYRQSPLVDPQGPEEGTYRMSRGAGWFDGPGTKEKTDQRLRSAYRGGSKVPGTRFDRLGFRVVRAIDLPTTRERNPKRKGP